MVHYNLHFALCTTRGLFPHSHSKTIQQTKFGAVVEVDGLHFSGVEVAEEASLRGGVEQVVGKIEDLRGKLRLRPGKTFTINFRANERVIMCGPFEMPYIRASRNAQHCTIGPRGSLRAPVCANGSSVTNSACGRGA